MRTVKRLLLTPNKEKRKAVEKLCKAYGREKRYWLRYFHSWEKQALLSRPRSVRDEKIKEKYSSILQARHWKLALDDAASCWDKYWESIFMKVRPHLFRKKFSEEERHYGFWLLSGYSQFAKMMQGKVPIPNFAIELAQRKTVASYLHRLVRKIKGKAPTAKIARSVRFDANCYEVFEENGTQYIKLMSLDRGKRIILPLSGNTPISGTIILIVSKEGMELHIPQELKKKKPLNGKMEAVDFGYTEVMTDSDDIRYGKAFGSQLTSIAEERNQKGKKRQKLYALAKSSSKSKKIRKFNLGKIKQRAEAGRSTRRLENQINQAINTLLRTKKPSLLVTEDLRHTFTYKYSKTMNRRLSGWLRGTIQDRISFKALAEGFCHQQVNPAYGSQSCPLCEFVDQKNRKGDSFQCLYCGYENASDCVAALNYARRIDDPEIGQYTPYCQVKTILLERFHRRLESGQPETVPGRTLDTEIEMHPPSLSTHHVIAGRDFLAHQTVNQRAKQKNKHVLTRF